MSAKRVVKVTILGREYAFASQGDEADDHIRRVAEMVDERMREVAHRSSRQAPLQVAVLTGLELVDELLRLQRDADQVEERIAERTSRLSSSLGQLLGDLEETGSTHRRFDAEPVTPSRVNEQEIARADTSGDAPAGDAPS